MLVGKESYDRGHRQVIRRHHPAGEESDGAGGRHRRWPEDLREHPEGPEDDRQCTAPHSLDSELSVFTRRLRGQGGPDGPWKETGGCGAR